MAIDKKLQELEKEVQKAKDNLSGASTYSSGTSTYSSYGAKNKYEIAKEALAKAQKNLEDYKSNKKNNTPLEQYPGQAELSNLFQSRGLDLVTQPDGTIVVANTKEVGESGKSGYLATDQLHFLYVGPEGFTPSPTTRPFEKGGVARGVEVNTNFDDVKRRIITDAQRSPEGLDGLLNKLYNSGYISKATRDSKDISSNEFNKGLFVVVNDYGKKIVSDYQFGDKSKEPISFDSYLSSAKVPTSKTRFEAVATLRQDADDDINKFFMDFLGRGASQQERDEYYTKLRSMEKKNVIKTTTTEGGTTTSGDLVSDEEKISLARTIAGKNLNGSNIDAVLKSGAGAARSINGLVDFAKQYGIKLSTKDATDYLAQDLSGGRFDEKAIKSKIANISKATYSNLSELSDEISVKDLSRNLIMTMGQVLELDPNGIDVMDPTIQKALKNNGNKGIMNLNDFEIMLRNDPRWARTKNAKEEASRYAYEILNSFGLMA